MTSVVHIFCDFFILHNKNTTKIRFYRSKCFDDEMTNLACTSLIMSELILYQSFPKRWRWNSLIHSSFFCNISYQICIHLCLCTHVFTGIYTASRLNRSLYLHSSGKTPPLLSLKHPHSLVSSQSTSTLSPFLKKSLRRSTQRLRLFKWGHGDQWSNSQPGTAPMHPLHPLYFRKPDNRDKKSG